MHFNISPLSSTAHFQGYGLALKQAGVRNTSLINAESKLTQNTVRFSKGSDAETNNSSRRSGLAKVTFWVISLLSLGSIACNPASILPPCPSCTPTPTPITTPSPTPAPTIDLDYSYEVKRYQESNSHSRSQNAYDSQQIMEKNGWTKPKKINLDKYSGQGQSSREER